MEVIMYIGDIIKAFREEHQLSQETFAAKAGLTVSEINTLEQNFQDGSSTPVPVAIRQIKGIAQAMEQPMPVIMSQNNHPTNKLWSTSSLNQISLMPNKEQTPHYEKISYSNAYIPCLNGSAYAVNIGDLENARGYSYMYRMNGQQYYADNRVTFVPGEGQ